MINGNCGLRIADLMYRYALSFIYIIESLACDELSRIEADLKSKICADKIGSRSISVVEGFIPSCKIQCGA